MKYILYTLLIILNFSFTAYSSDMFSSDISNLNLQMLRFSNSDENISLYAVKNVIHKNTRDASGSVAQIKLTGFDSEDLRIKFYTKILTELIKMEDFNLDESIAKAFDYIDDSKAFVDGYRYLGEGLQDSLELIDENKFLKSIFRKYYLKWGKHATFKNVSKRIANLNKGLDEINSYLKTSSKVLQFSIDCYKLWLQMEIHTGLILDRLNMLSNYLSQRNKKILNDPAFKKAIEKIESSIVKKPDDFLDEVNNMIHLFENKGSFEKILDDLADGGIKIVAAKKVYSLLSAKNIAHKNFFTAIAVESISELIHEFRDAPKKIIEHFLISTLLIDGYAINPVSEKDIKKFIFNSDASSLNSYVNIKLKTYLLYMFYKNLSEIMTDTGWVDTLHWLNPVCYMEKAFYGGEFIDREKVNDLSIEIQNKLKAYNNKVESIPVFFCIQYKSDRCYPWNKAPLDLNFEIVGNNIDKINNIYWTVYKQHETDYLFITNINQATNIAFNCQFENEGRYTIIATGKTDSGIYVSSSKSVSIRSDTAEIRKILIKSDNMERVSHNNYLMNSSNIEQSLYAYIEYTDDTYEIPINLSKCNAFKWTNLTPDYLEIIYNSNSLITFKPKKIGNASLKVSLNGHEEIVDIKILPVFLDVPINSWFYKAVYKLYNIGMIKAHGDKKYYPEKYIKRAEFISFLVKASGKQCPFFGCSNEVPFSDVNIYDWYYPFIKAAYNEGWIIYDSTHKQFRPEDNINRAEAAYLLTVALNKLNTSVHTKNIHEYQYFDDVKNISDWYYEPVYILKDLGIFRGYINSKDKKIYFRPSHPMNKAEAAVVIYEAFLSN